MKSGFTLLELIVFLAVASALSVLLFRGFFQANRILQNAGAMIDIDQRILLLQDRLERDITGAFVPMYQPTKGEQKEEIARQQKPGTQEVQKPLPKLFLSTNQGENLKELTFITNNPLSVYGIEKPLIARVRYQLKPDAQHKGTFELVRQESAKLAYADIASDKGAREYVVADNIKAFSLQYRAEAEKKKNQKKNAQEEKAQESESSYTTSKTWDSDKQVQEKQKSKKPFIPQFVELKITLADATGKHFTTYQNLFPVYAADLNFNEKKQQYRGPEKSMFGGQDLVRLDRSPNMSRAIQDLQQKRGQPARRVP